MIYNFYLYKIKVTKLEKLIELNNLAKQTRQRLEDKLRRQECYGEIERVI